MDVFELILGEHEMARRRLVEMTQQPPDAPNVRRTLVDALREQLEGCFRVEEAHLYPRLAQLPAAARHVHGARLEHQHIAALLRDMEAESSAAKWLVRAHALSTACEQHFVREDLQMLAPLRAALRDDEAMRIAEQMRRLRA